MRRRAACFIVTFTTQHPHSHRPTSIRHYDVEKQESQLPQRYRGSAVITTFKVIQGR